MERLIASFLLLIVSPLLLVLFFLIKLTSKGPFIYKQIRAGKNFKRFTIYKIRTMVKDAEKQKEKIKHLNEIDGPVFKIKDDPRFTEVGKFLSKTGFDEILQLINIVKGEMSFVGPRPLPIDEALKVPKKYDLRFSLKPGITSLWIIKGAHKLSFYTWMESDLEYLKNKNILKNVEIIAKTTALVIKWTADLFIDGFKKLVLIKLLRLL